MYLEFFGLSSAPFSIAPDPDFLYLTEKHQEALAHLLYSTTQKGGFVLLTGEVGTGKTTLCRHFLRIVPDQYQTAFIFNPKISSEELLATICDEFGIERPEGTHSIKQLTDLINRRLLDIHASGKNALLVIDEAQNLSMDVLEQIRLLTNLETTEHKLLQIILIGQPQLRTLLRCEDLQQLSQRIVARYHLDPLSAQETDGYIKYRLAASGCDENAANALFPAATLREIYRRTRGIPRLINVLCDRALLGAYVENSRTASQQIVRKAAREAFDDETDARPSMAKFPRWAQGAVAAGLLAIAGVFFWHSAPSPVVTAATAETPHAGIISAADSPEAKPAPLLPASAGQESAAYQSLLRLWNAPSEAIEAISGEKDACQAAPRYHLRCLSGANRNWHQFRLFNLPAVLTLRDTDQRSFHAVIESATEDRINLLIDGQAVALNPNQLAFYWTGRFTLLWRPPAGYLTDAQLTQNSIIQLMANPPPWLFEQLGADSGNRLPLRRLIENFQQRAGIQADGIIGLQTLIMLSRQAENTPVLQANP